ncbi:hypothetical protein ACP26L_36245 (plasmid) [Paenibacillus sp. S-38]|uniref:ParM/StbA family protein n=1 Tax=Paenibacillus sp. S-38 TaxID=3416710 RepID=UPI003CE76F90
MAKTPVIRAIDDGYGDTKLYDGKEFTLLPSYATAWREPERSELKELQEDRLSYIKAETDGKAYLVGKGAVEQDSRGSWVGGDNKHKDKRFIVIFRTCLALIAPKDTDVIDLLAMSLPVEVDEDEKRHEFLRNLVVGWHKIKVTLADGTVIDREINVKEVIIKNQPFAAYCSKVLNKQGDIANPELASGFNVLVDIGARTRNVFAWKALKPQKDYKTQSFDGMFEAFSEIGRRIKQETGARVADIKIQSILEEGNFNGLTEQQLQEIKEDVYDDHANRAVGDVEKLLVNAKGQIHNVLWGCGGAELLKPYIEEYMTDYNLIFLNRFSVVEGLYYLAVVAWNKKESTSKTESKPASSKAQPVEAQELQA